MRLAAIAAAMVCAAGCGAPTPAPDTAPAVEATARVEAPPIASAATGGSIFAFDGRYRPVGLMERPTVFERHTFDPNALATPRALPEHLVRQKGWFTIVSREDRYFSHLGRALVGELEIDTKPAYRAYAGAAEPRSFMRGPPTGPPCGAKAPPSSGARWSGIVQSDFSETSLVFEMYEGSFDAARCRAEARSGETVRATAIVPGLLYAFRKGEEEIAFIGPPADWVSSSSAPAEQASPHVGTLTLVSVPIRPGTSGSAVLVVALENVDFFEALRASTSDGFAGLGMLSKGLSMRADVVWPADGAEPTGVAFVSTLAVLPGSR